MLLNDSALNDAALDDVVQPFALLRIGSLSDSLAMNDDGRAVFRDVIASSDLTMLQDVIATILRGEGFVNSKTISELGLALQDSIVAARLRQRILSETISLTEQVLGIKVNTRYSAESITLADDGRQINWDITASASISVIDQLLSSIIAGGGVAIRIASDAILLSDGTTKALYRSRGLEELIATVEGGFGRDVSVNAQFSDTLDVAEETLLRRLRTFVFSEGMTLIDLIVRSAVGNRLVTASDAIVLSDASIVSRLRTRNPQDLLGMTDQQLRALQRLLSIVDGVTFTDEYLRIRFQDRRTSEIITTIDNSISQISYAITYDVRAYIGRVTPKIVLGRSI